MAWTKFKYTNKIKKCLLIVNVKVQWVIGGSSAPAPPATPAQCSVLPQPSGLLCWCPAAQHRGQIKEVSGKKSQLNICSKNICFCCPTPHPPNRLQSGKWFLSHMFDQLIQSTMPNFYTVREIMKDMTKPTCSLVLTPIESVLWQYGFKWHTVAAGMTAGNVF